jgi:hypothetical protein
MRAVRSSPPPRSYFLYKGDVASANRLGFHYEVTASKIQRAWRRFCGNQDALQAEAASRALVDAATQAAMQARERESEELERESKELEDRMKRAKEVLARGVRRKRKQELRTQARLSEIASRLWLGKVQLIQSRFVRILTERVYERAKRQHEAALVISRTFKRMEVRESVRKTRPTAPPLPRRRGGCRGWDEPVRRHGPPAARRARCAPTRVSLADRRSARAPPCPHPPDRLPNAGTAPHIRSATLPRRRPRSCCGMQRLLALSASARAPRAPSWRFATSKDCTRAACCGSSRSTRTAS